MHSRCLIIRRALVSLSFVLLWRDDSAKAGRTRAAMNK